MLYGLDLASSIGACLITGLDRSGLKEGELSGFFVGEFSLDVREVGSVSVALYTLLVGC